ncbi:ATP-grasp domain-containing protein [Paenibacillus sp. N4]|uniref:ATP-grasp domain-containing protein n=1 Tax=Paenibacillus vietnamensis TaxID=2590547 RepID=UPI001CD08A4F|nr:ATP-grasp domain-containing protein [Paenibacillus vietnamensis]MCA0757190.1 ATP-grasp domain-containing protein [Paenibacillus vietnamensis]
MEIKPSVTLYDIYGPGYVFNQRASYRNMQWLPDSVSQHSDTGRLLSIAGKMPILCHSGVIEPSSLSILKESGLQLANKIHTYCDERSYYKKLNEFNHSKDKVVVNFPHLLEELNYNKYWIAPELIAYLNNKGNLKDLVPKQNLARRKVLSISDFAQEKNFPFGLPFVAKAATDEPQGGGIEVVICKNNADLQYAKQLFNSCNFVVMEEQIPILRNYCVQFVQTYKGDFIYLGAAEQIINEGKYTGNWVTQEDNQLPEKVIQLGEQIMEKAVSLGYYGIAGFDIVISEDNRIIAIDLNFRMNASTVALLLKESIMESLQVNTLKFRNFKTFVSLNKFERTIKTFIQQKRLVPLSIYNPSNLNSDEPIILYSILVGNSKEEVNKIEQQLLNQLEC